MSFDRISVNLNSTPTLGFERVARPAWFEGSTEILNAEAIHFIVELAMDQMYARQHL